MREYRFRSPETAGPSNILRDLEDATETYPDAHWPAQAQRALRGLIHAWNQARDGGLAAIAEATARPLITEFRRAGAVGLAAVPRIPGPKNSTAQHPGRDLLEFCRDHEDDVLRFTTDTRIWPTDDLASHCTSWGRCAVFVWGGRLGWLADVILAWGGDIFAGSRAAGDAVRVAAA